MKKIILCITIVILSAFAADAQGIRDRARQYSIMNMTQNSTSTKKSNQSGFLGSDPPAPKEGVPVIKSKVDTIFLYSNPIDSLEVAYYARITKKNGWMVGVGKSMTLDEASHLNCYYKLSLKNYAGNWTSIEAYNGYGHLTTYHNIGTYLVNQFDDTDSGVNANWRELLKTVCKWEFIGDPSGEVVVQERALDSEGNIVYVYNPVKIGHNKYTGSYTDKWGMPVFMRTDSLGNDIGYANFVHIERDDRGFDVKLAFSDRNGCPQLNKDGSYMTYKEYDDEGNQTKEASMNIVGDYMTDSWGNCGWEAVYENHNMARSSYFDSDWKPVRMPCVNSYSESVYAFKYEYDEYGRNTVRYVIDDKGKPDVDQHGVHKVKTVYNDNGAFTHRTYYDLAGQLCPSDDSGVAQEIFEFDSYGNALLIEFKDKYGRYVFNPAYGVCKRVMNVKDNDVISQVDYIVGSNGDKLVKIFEYAKDDYGHTRKTWYQENRVLVDSVDALGNNVAHAWYDLKGNRIADEEGIHNHTHKYEQNIDVEEWFGDDGEHVLNQDGYSKSISIFDLEKNLITNYQYHHDALKQSFTKQFTPNYEQIIAQWDVTPYGEHARVGWWDNLHYVCDVDYTLHGDIRTMVGRNEFGEASYLTFLDEDGLVYHFSDSNNGDWRYYDEFGKVIPKGLMEEFKKNLPKAFCVEVTDTTIANQYGLKNGDIIISYGNWMVFEDLKTNIYEFYLSAILYAESDKHVTLLRHHPEVSKSEIVKCVLPKGKPSDLGFYPHMIYYTQKEKERLLSTCNDYKFSLPNIRTNNDYTLILAVPVKGAYLTTTLYHDPVYNILDPGVVIAGEENFRGRIDKWDMSKTVAEWESLDMFRIKDSHLYISQDANTVRHIYKKFRGLGGMRFIPVTVSKEVYDRLMKCNQAIVDNVDKKDAQENAINKKVFWGNWKSQIDGILDIFLTINKNKSWDISFRVPYSEDINESISIKVNIDISNEKSGAWNLKDNELILSNPEFKCKVEFKDWQIYGSVDLNKKTKQEFIKEAEPMLISLMNENITALESQFDNLIATSIDENTILVNDLVFNRAD